MKKVSEDRLFEVVNVAEANRQSGLEKYTRAAWIFLPHRHNRNIVNT